MSTLATAISADAAAPLVFDLEYPAFKLIVLGVCASHFVIASNVLSSNSIRYLRYFVFSTILFSSCLSRSTSYVAIPLLFNSLATGTDFELYLPMLQLACANRTIDFVLERNVRCPLKSSEVITLSPFSCCSVIMPGFDMVPCFLHHPYILQVGNMIPWSPENRDLFN
jgi:hypothetical protein